MLEFSQNYFELFDLPVAYNVDSDLLIQRFRKLQRATHPDRFVKASDQERRMALQKATQVNEAFQVLNNCISRSRYLLHLHGIEFNSDHATVLDPQFLMQQMELREKLEKISSQEDPFGAIVNLIAHVDEQSEILETKISTLFDEQKYEQIKELISEYQFFSKLRNEAETLEAEIEDNTGNL